MLLPMCEGCGHEYRLHVVGTDKPPRDPWCGACEKACRYAYPTLLCGFCGGEIGQGERVEPPGQGPRHRRCWLFVEKVLFDVYDGWEPPPGAMVPPKEATS